MQGNNYAKQLRLAKIRKFVNLKLVYQVNALKLRFSYLCKLHYVVLRFFFKKMHLNTENLMYCNSLYT